ncbi:Fic family protein [Candidatus Woesearchaeota archaeon]|nr:Fic family protein [Candidatus Woesearchaeota archaeon]
MAYHETVKRGKKRYHYLVENARVGKKFRKAKVYLASGDVPEDKLETLAKSKSNILKDRVRALLSAEDPLFAALAPAQIEELEQIKLEGRRKLKGLDWKNYYEWFVTKFTYDTNAIEGSTVTLQETGMILFDRIVPEGRSVREINEVQNHKDTFDYMLAYRKGLTKPFILKLHKLLMHNILWKQAGVFRNVDVYLRNVEVRLPRHTEVEREFRKLMQWYAKSASKYHPVVAAAHFHVWFESVHPFRDGNGRIGRLLLNFMLRKAGYPMIDIKNKDKRQYYDALYQAQKNGKITPLVNLIIGYMRTAYGY